MAVALVTVVSGDVYQRHARAMFDSAFQWFGPDPVVAHIILPGRVGWPEATLYRYHALLEHARLLAGFDYAFMIDADMRFEAPVGKEILGGVVATVHPGYVGKGRRALPYERRPASKACSAGDIYYCGGFIGGRTIDFMRLARSIARSIDIDSRKGITARWHDESHLNAYLNRRAPNVTLTPSYCYPDNDATYVSWWPQRYERILVAVDKPHEERAGRD